MEHHYTLLIVVKVVQEASLIFLLRYTVVGAPRRVVLMGSIVLARVSVLASLKAESVR
jgi:hypothetical protein